MQRKPFAEWLAENKCNFSSAIIIIGSDIINIGRCFYLPKQIVRRAQIEEAGKPTPQINENVMHKGSERWRDGAIFASNPRPTPSRKLST
jgi:hypothetical protein